MYLFQDLFPQALLGSLTPIVPKLPPTALAALFLLLKLEVLLRDHLLWVVQEGLPGIKPRHVSISTTDPDRENKADFAYWTTQIPTKESQAHLGHKGCQRGGISRHWSIWEAPGIWWW